MLKPNNKNYLGNSNLGLFGLIASKEQRSGKRLRYIFGTNNNNKFNTHTYIHMLLYIPRSMCMWLKQTMLRLNLSEFVDNDLLKMQSIPNKFEACSVWPACSSSRIDIETAAPVTLLPATFAPVVLVLNGFILQPHLMHQTAEGEQ